MNKKPFTLPVRRLELLPLCRILANEAARDCDAEIDDDSWLSWYMKESVLQSLSIGSGQTTVNQGRSARAFVAVLRTSNSDRKAIWQAMDFRRGNTFDALGFAQVVCDVLGRSPEYALGLPFLLRTTCNVEPSGPFCPKATRLPIKVLGQENLRRWDSRYMKSLAQYYADRTESNLTDEDRSLVALAGLVRVVQADLDSAAHGLRMRGLTNVSLQVAVSRMVLDTLRSNDRFLTGVNWAQPKTSSGEGDEPVAE